MDRFNELNIEFQLCISSGDGMLGSSVIDSFADPSSTETCLDLDSAFGISTSTTFFFGVMGCFVTNLEFFFSIFGAAPSEIG